MKVIDHKAYPHVIDKIIKNASPATLSALRCTSKQYKAKVDSLLKHLVVDMREVIPSALRWVRVSSRVGDIELMFPRPDLFKLSYDDAKAAVLRDRAALEPYLGQAAVLDLLGPLTYNMPPLPAGVRTDPGDWWLHLDSKYPSDRTLRVLGDHLGRLPKLQRISARTVVFFGGSVAPAPGEQPQIVNQAEPSQDAEKIVLNMPIQSQRFYKEDGHVSLQIGRGAGSFLRDVVFVFQQVDEEGNLLPPKSEYASKDSSKRGEIPDTSDDGGWIAVFDNLTEILIYTHPRITIVGLPPRFYMGDSLVDPAACLRSHIEDLASEAGLWDFVKNRVRFVSLPEYLRGPDAYVETSLPEWPKRLPRSIKDATRVLSNPLFGDSEQLYYR